MDGKSCKVIEIVTPKGYLLNGLWFGPAEPKRVLVYVHGLSSTVFAHHEYLLPLVDSTTAVLFFNNRGNGNVTGIKKIDSSSSKGYRRELIGASHEVFTDCVDDLEGAVSFAKKTKARQVFLVGHSTGCQKSVYYISRKAQNAHVNGVVLIAPISDYAAALATYGVRKVKSVENFAKKLVKNKRPHEILPLTIWPEFTDAQRFLSLNTKDSTEEIFCYCQPGKKPKILQKVEIPTLAIFAELDEHRDRDTNEIAEWFEKNLKSASKKISIVKGANHGFTKKEVSVTKEIRVWLKENFSK